MTDGADGEHEDIEAPGAGFPGGRPPVEQDTATRDMMFAPVTKVRGGQRETATPGEAVESNSGEAQPFHALQDEEAASMQPSTWSSLTAHPRFKLGALAVILAAVLLSGVLAWSVTTGTDAPRQQAEQFLDYLNAFDYQRAEAITNQQCSGGATAALLSGIFGGRNFQHDLVDTKLTGSAALVTGSAEVAGVGEVPVKIHLLFIDGEWAICGIAAR